MKGIEIHCGGANYPKPGTESDFELKAKFPEGSNWEALGAFIERIIFPHLEPRERDPHWYDVKFTIEVVVHRDGEK